MNTETTTRERIMAIILKAETELKESGWNTCADEFAAEEINKNLSNCNCLSGIEGYLRGMHQMFSEGWEQAEFDNDIEKYNRFCRAFDFAVALSKKVETVMASVEMSDIEKMEYKLERFADGDVDAHSHKMYIRALCKRCKSIAEIIENLEWLVNSKTLALEAVQRELHRKPFDYMTKLENRVASHSLEFAIKLKQYAISIA